MRLGLGGVVGAVGFGFVSAAAVQVALVLRVEEALLELVEVLLEEIVLLLFLLRMLRSSSRSCSL